MQTVLSTIIRKSSNRRKVQFVSNRSFNWLPWALEYLSKKPEVYFDKDSSDLSSI